MRRVALAAFALVTLAVLALSWVPLVKPWEAWKPDYCRLVNCFCEPFREGLVLQPISAYSNLGFVLVGMLILGASRTPAVRDSAAAAPNLMLRHRAYPLVFGVVVAAVGFGSFFYHASLTAAGEWFDLMGMYALAGFMMLYNLARLRPLSGAAFAALDLAISGVLGVQMIIAPRLQQLCFDGLVAGVLVFEVAVHLFRRPQVAWRYLVTALASFGAGGVIWLLDRDVLPCAPGSWVTWHSIWHVLTAVAAGLIYLYYLSEVQVAAK
jgi:ceramidase